MTGNKWKEESCPIFYKSFINSFDDDIKERESLSKQALDASNTQTVPLRPCASGANTCTGVLLAPIDNLTIQSA